MESQDQITLNLQQEEKLRKSITHAVDIKALFELYAYRIIDHQTFVEKVKNLIEEYAN